MAEGKSSAAERRAEQQELRRTVKDLLERKSYVWEGGLGADTEGKIKPESAEQLFRDLSDEGIEFCWKD